MSSDSSGSVLRYTSEFMRSLKNVESAREVPSDIIRRYVDEEFYTSKQKFDPDRLNNIKSDTGVKEISLSSKDDASLQPQQRQSWTRGCGVSNQAKGDPQGATQGPSSTLTQATKLPSHVSNAQMPMLAAAARQAGIFAPNNRPMGSTMQTQPGSLRGPRGTADFGLGYASTYRPPRDSHRPPFGRGRGMGGRAYDESDLQHQGNHRFPPPLFQQGGMRHGFGGYGGNRGFGRKHAQSHGDSMPEWYNDSDPFTMIELGGELPSSSQSSSPVESLGDEGYDEAKAPEPQHQQNSARTVPEEITAPSGTSNKQSVWDAPADKERPASQQADFTYLLWSTLQNDLGDLGSRGETVSSSTAEITGSKLWSIWKDSGASSTSASGMTLQGDQRKEPKSCPQQPSTLGANPALRGWLDNAQAEQMTINTQQQHQQPLPQSQSQPQVSVESTRLTAAEEHPGSAASPAPRGLNPNELFAKFSVSNGPAMASQSQPMSQHLVSSQNRKSPTPAGGMMSVEDLERKMLMKMQSSGKVEKDEQPERVQRPPQPQQKSFYDAPPGGQQQHPPAKADESGHMPSQQAGQPGANPANFQMQLAAAQQAMMSALAAANSGSGAPSGSAMSQQKMFLTNFLQQQLATSSGNVPPTSSGATPNGGPSMAASGQQQVPPGLPPFLNMFPPNALAAAAAAAASASSPLMYYPQLMQQAQAQAAAAGRHPTTMPSAGSNPPSGVNAGGVASRPPFPMPPPGTFPNFPPMNPSAAANLMAAALSHFQQQQQQQGANKSASPVPNATGANPSQQPQHSQMPLSNPNFAAAAAAAATALMASRMGMNPNMAFPPGQPGGQQFPHFPGGMMPPQPPMGQANPGSAPSQTHHPHQAQHPQQQQQQQQQQQRPVLDENPRARIPSPAVNAASNTATSASKLNTSFIPTQVMMKNPHSINSSPDTPSTAPKPSSAGSRAGMTVIGRTNAVKPQNIPSTNAAVSYSSVAGGSGNDSSGGVTTDTTANAGKSGRMWTAEDLERTFKNNSYSAYPPLQHQSLSQNQRTAGIAAGSTAPPSGNIGPSRVQGSETAHQFSVADLLRGAANANKAAAQSSAGYT